ncbi:hypothetical protein PL81_08795, partial [Streptomyces sp. RSD-27]
AGLDPVDLDAAVGAAPGPEPDAGPAAVEVLGEGGVLALVVDGAPAVAAAADHLLGGLLPGLPLGDGLGGGAGDGPDLWARSWAGYAQALLQRRDGRPALARTWLLRSLKTQLALGDRLGQALSVELLAQLEADLGRYELSARLLGAVSGYRPASACAPRAERVLRLKLTPEALRTAYAEGARTPLRELLPEL